MQQRNLTSYRLAKDCNVGRAAVSKWLLEQRVPNFESIVIVAQYLNCSVDFLIGRGR
jgi:transcriptional regulator with XRE-family HTH domain